MSLYIHDPSDLYTLRQNSGRVLVLGVFMIALGLIALINTAITTLVSMFFLGWIFISAGLIEVMQAIHYQKNGRFFLHALHSALSIVVGIMLFIHPIEATLVTTSLIAAYFCVMGACRIVTALKVHTPRWGWTLVDGIVCLVLGTLIWMQWPTPASWMIGLFIGINLLFTGWSEVELAVAIRHMQRIPII